ncbi:YeeE/YedE family integral membrane protein [Tricharina praecox]|uniref:YeeE/YedE family integral membrane protein n=1 Tax=Tricharina praecox TaxID=43433 RepID=UPI00221F4D50|nr:YeeE/YedE family integral membrane protein [Tricharina praecox]KAI5846137.1 YeeE/YedE family integral membrane protein [Tricharina praecox]
MFTPVTTTLGAVLLHLSTTTLLHSNSQILGCSSLLTNGILHPSLSTTPTLLGLLAAAALPLYPPSYPTDTSLPLLLAAGALVGVGTKLAKGCTSGHMLLGVARGSVRSLVATATFFASAVATAAVVSSPPACINGACYTPTYPAAGPAVLLVAGAAVGALVIRRLPKTEAARVATRVYAGFVFGLGLLVSGMASPAKTLGFMSVTNWNNFDPSLMAVALVGVGGNAIAWLRRKSSPRLVDEWTLPAGEVEWRLVVGSVLFGVGWGLVGVCPGPAVVAALRNGTSGLAWVGAFLAGQVAAGYV